MEIKNVKVLLILPNTPQVATKPPLGLMYIAASLRVRGHQPEIIEGSLIDVRSHIHDSQTLPDFVGITCMTSQFHEIIRIRDYFHYAHVPVIFGGPHASALPRSLLSMDKNAVDYVVVGEGEKTMVKIVEGKIHYDGYDGGIIVQGELTQDLDSLPFPARDLVNRRYHRKSVSLLGSRGCPFNCSFCQPTLRNIFGNEIRRRSVDNIISEMMQCSREFGVRTFEFFDDTFTFKKQWVYDFCDSVQSLHFRWRALSRVDMLDYDILKRMKKAGLYRLSIGLESGSQEILNSYSKGVTVEQSRKVLAWCKELGIEVHGFFMIGSLEETRESIEATKQFIRSSEIHTMFVAITTPMPCTRLYEQAEKEGRLFCDWREFDFLGNLTTTGSASEHLESMVPMKLKYLSAEDVIQARKDILRSFYFRKLRNPLYLINYLRENGMGYTWSASKKLLRRS